MGKFLDEVGLGYLWQKIKSYVDTANATSVKKVNQVEPDEFNNVTVEAANIFYDNDTRKLHSSNVQNAIDELDEKIHYNAINEFDATVQSAPPNLPRGHNWHVLVTDPLIENHQYSRYFYRTFGDADQDTPGAPLLNKAVAHWVIDGKRIYFEFLENGYVHTIVDMTDEQGNILINEYRPITIGDVWYFGKNQQNPFPTHDNVRSLLDINVEGLSLIVGNTFDLTTTNTQVVGAINELNAKMGTFTVHEAETSEEAQLYSQSHPDVLVYVARD